jgi:neutral ceramidase
MGNAARHIRRAALTLFVTTTLTVVANIGLAGTLQVGVASVDITPPLGAPMAGYYHERGADGVLDPLFSKAMVIERDGTRMAFIALDIICVTQEITTQARAKIEEQTGIPSDYVMISATHAHTGPELVRRSRRVDDMGGQNKLALEFKQNLPDRIAETVHQANENLQPAELKIASGHCEDLAYNRRYFMRDGTVGWNPGKLNPNIVMPAGPIDPEVGILYAEQPGANGPTESIATFLNFAMHPDTTGGSKFSADWPGAMARVLASYHGQHHVTLVGNGACGNINNYDFFWKWPNNGPGEQNRIGAILGASVFQAYKDLKPIGDGPIRARSEIVEFALPEISSDDVDAARKAVSATKDDRGANFMTLVRSYRVLDVAGRKGKPHRVEVQVIAIGDDVAWVSLPGEVFVELGLAIKQRSPYPLTFCVELANDNIGYIPDRRSYAEGNYEPESARCDVGSGEKLVEAAVRLLETVKTAEE